MRERDREGGGLEERERKWRVMEWEAVSES